MKKVVLICALAAAFCAGAAQLKKVENLRAGDLGTFGSGKITSVEVVSDSASGTVALKRVAVVDIYTNAYDVTVSTSRVMEVGSVTTNRFFDHVSNGVVVATYVQDPVWTNFQFFAQSGIVTNRYFDFYVNGKLERVFEEGGTNAVKNGYHYKDPMYLKSGAWRIYYERLSPDLTSRIYWILVDPTGATNATVAAEYGIGYVGAKEIDFGEYGKAVERVEVVPTSSAAGGKIIYDRDLATYGIYWSVVDAGGATNATVRAETGVGWWAHNINFGEFGVMNERLEFINSYVTNTVISYATNSVTPVLKDSVGVTNSVVNGSCSGGYYKGAPEGGMWLFSGDHLIFEGTATGGLLRLVVE